MASGEPVPTVSGLPIPRSFHPASSLQPRTSRTSTNGPFLRSECSFLSKYNYLYVNMPQVGKNVASDGQQRFRANPLRNQSLTHSFLFACDQSPVFSSDYKLPPINEKRSPLESGDYTLPREMGGGGVSIQDKDPDQPSEQGGCELGTTASRPYAGRRREGGFWSAAPESRSFGIGIAAASGGSG